MHIHNVEIIQYIIIGVTMFAQKILPVTSKDIYFHLLCNFLLLPDFVSILKYIYL